MLYTDGTRIELETRMAEELIPRPGVVSADMNSESTDTKVYLADAFVQTSAQVCVTISLCNEISTVERKKCYNTKF